MVACSDVNKKAAYKRNIRSLDRGTTTKKGNWREKDGDRKGRGRNIDGGRRNKEERKGGVVINEGSRKKGSEAEKYKGWK